jgi:hypothetical protein
MSVYFIRPRSLWHLTLDNQIRSEDTHSANTNTGLGGSVGGTETSEDNGRGAPHCTEERL